MTDSAIVGTEETVPAELLRSVFRQHAAGVAVITAHGDEPVGFTATSLNSVALEPPLVSFGISIANSCWPVIAEAKHVGIHILADHQQTLAATFASSGADRFAEPTAWHRGPGGVPLLDGVLARLVCRVTARVPTADHCIVVAEVLTGNLPGQGRPLVYQGGRYHGLEPARSPAPPPAASARLNF